MSKKLVLFLTFLAVLCLSDLAAADVEAGKLLSLTGSVTIDAFGKGSFIPAVAGDLLYESSVLKTGAEGRATIVLRGRQQEIASGATVRVSDLLVSAGKRKGLGWLQALGNLFRSVAETAQQKDEELALVSRAARAPSAEEDIEWETDEIDPGELFAEAREDIARTNYVQALSRLQAIPPDAEGVQAWDVAFWKGYCYFQLEDYGDAAAVHATLWNALGTSKAQAVPRDQRRILQFQLAASRYFLGQEDSAIPLLDSLIGEKTKDDYEPFAYLFLAKSLASAGNVSRARTVAEEGSKRFAGTALAQQFTALLTELPSSR